MIGIPERKKPKNIDEYEKWLKDEFEINLGNRVENHYEGVLNQFHSTVTQSGFWTELSGLLTEFEQEYTLKTNYPLFLRADVPNLNKKPYLSFVEKTFRKNILNNRKWPSPPTKSGWLTPENWFERVGDLVRTTLVVKYLDGVDFLVEKLSDLAAKNDLKCQPVFESRDEGYYAAHFYVNLQCQIPTMNWDSEERTLRFEIQVTTQLQEVIRRLLHSYYETRRSNPPKSSSRQWQWDYRSEEFGANYLGHILHYLEGMIVEIREKKDD